MDPLLTALAILVGGFAISFVLACLLGPRVRRVRGPFVDEFPPISDEEFVARCSPGTSPEVALKVRQIIAEYSGVPYERVHPSMNFLWDLD